MSELEYFLSVKNIEISLYAQAQQSLLLLTQGNIYNRLSPGGGGGDSHMKQTGMLVVSLRGVNFGFWSRLGCSGQSANILCHQGLV